MRSLDALGKGEKGWLLEPEAAAWTRKCEVAKRQKEHSTGQSLQSECGVSGEAIGSQKGGAHGLESLQGCLNVNNKNYWFFKRNRMVFCKN